MFKKYEINNLAIVDYKSKDKFDTTVGYKTKEGYIDLKTNSLIKEVKQEIPFASFQDNDFFLSITDGKNKVSSKQAFQILLEYCIWVVFETREINRKLNKGKNFVYELKSKNEK